MLQIHNIPNIDFFPIFFSVDVLEKNLMIKSFSLFQDTQLWDRNPHKQGDTANISTQPNIGSGEKWETSQTSQTSKPSEWKDKKDIRKEDIKRLNDK